MLPTLEELEKMKDMDIMEADREQLVDISEIQKDKNQTADIRIGNYLEQVHNPYLVKSGEYVLQFKYADREKDISDLMAEYASKMTKIRC